MNIILCGIILVLAYFVYDLVIYKFLILLYMPAKHLSLGLYWFCFLAFINVSILIFVPYYYYTHDDSGPYGPRGDRGHYGIPGLYDNQCPDC
jgi:hypothetical protein